MEWKARQEFSLLFFHTQPNANKREKFKFSRDFFVGHQHTLPNKIFRPASKSTNSCWCLSYPCSTGKHTLSVLFSNSKKHNLRLFTQTVSQPRHREHCVFLHFIQKVLNFILLEVMLYLTIMDFKIF